MPDRARFENEANYYATLFHELVHSTGHEKRLKRSTLAGDAKTNELKGNNEAVQNSVQNHLTGF